MGLEGLILRIEKDAETGLQEEGQDTRVISQQQRWFVHLDRWALFVYQMGSKHFSSWYKPSSVCPTAEAAGGWEGRWA